jgi:enamine deaminase RidA (YjgF/YER057c/UK114 family)
MGIKAWGVKARVEPLELWEAVRQGATGHQSAHLDRLRRFLSGQHDPADFALRLLYKDCCASPEPSCYRAGASSAPNAAAWWCEPDQESRMVLKIERFQPEGMNVRMSGGKPSYSHVVTVSGSGKIVYTAGQLARDVDGNCVGKGDMRAQMEQTFQNLDRCLKAAGATWADVVKTNTFVTDFDEFQKCADIRMRYLGVATPTSTTVGVTRLAGPDFMIEIEAVAVVNS